MHSMKKQRKDSLHKSTKIQTFLRKTSIFRRLIISFLLLIALSSAFITFYGTKCSFKNPGCYAGI